MEFVDDGGDEGLGGQMAATTEGFDEAALAEFFAGLVERLGDAVGVKGERIAGTELALAKRTVPLLEKPDRETGGIEAIESAIAAKKKSGKMTAIGVAQTARCVVVVGVKKSGVGAIGRVFAEELIDGAQQALGLIGSNGAETPKIRLQVRHQKSRGNPLP